MKWLLYCEERGNGESIVVGDINGNPFNSVEKANNIIEVLEGYGYENIRIIELWKISSLG